MAAAPVALPPPPPTTVVIQTVNPEIAFAARVPEPAPPRPTPAHRRSVFFDVENTSRPSDVERVLDHLGLDFADRATEFYAVGNWRVVGHETARILASRGAQLIHSAPATGIRDWSDLRIAVSAGAWLASARAGDMIQIVSDDQAFDAVGDVAMSLGVSFDRLSYRRMAAGAAAIVEDVAPEERVSNADRNRNRRRRNGRRGGSSHSSERSRPPLPEPRRSAPPEPRRSAPRHAPPPPPRAIDEDDEAAQAASEAEIVDVVQQLYATSPNGVTLDALSNALKARGHRRPPGSLRLVTRVRRIKQIEVGRNGVIYLRDGDHPAPAPQAPPVAHRTPAAIEFDDGDEGSDASVAAEARELSRELTTIEPDLEGDDDGEGEGDDGAEAGAGEDGAPNADGTPGSGPRRRRRRGGRRRRGRGRSGGNGSGGEGVEAAAPPSETVTVG